jgi:hypothetical protein
MANDPLYIKNEMAGFDRKDRAYYDKLTDEQKKKFSTYLMLRWGASVTGNADMQEYYLKATNQRVNKNFFELGKKHTKLQWLMCTTVSPGMGKQYHYWLKDKKKTGTSNNKAEKFLAKIYPHMKQDEIEMMAVLNGKAALKDLAKQHGYSNEQIKSEF